MSADVVPFGLDEMARARLLAELYDLRGQIEAREAELAASEERLAGFRLLWHEQLGELLVECARLRANVAAARAEAQPGDSAAAEAADEARSSAEEAEEEWMAIGAPSTVR